MDKGAYVIVRRSGTRIAEDGCLGRSDRDKRCSKAMTSNAELVSNDKNSQRCTALLGGLARHNDG
jgi:hypothetical protein